MPVPPRCRPVRPLVQLRPRDPRTLALIPLLLLLLAAAPGGALAAGDAILQGVVGAARFDSDSLTFQVDTEQDGEEDLSSMPYVGLIGQYLFAGGSTRLGVEGGALFGWRSRDTTIVAGSNQAVVKIDSSLWLLDLSAGFCLEQRLGANWRLYLAAGPAMLFAEYEAEDDVEEGADPETVATYRGESESEFGVGGYARLGLEYEFAPRALVGVSVRGLATNMEFDNAVAAKEVSGVQGFLTFTRNFGQP